MQLFMQLFIQLFVQLFLPTSTSALFRHLLMPDFKIISGARKPMLNGGIRVHENVGQAESRKKAVKMLVAVVVMFGLCFLPNHSLNILRYMQHFVTFRCCFVELDILYYNVLMRFRCFQYAEFENNFS